MRTTIFTKQGRPITTINLELECSWVLSSEGKAVFPFALTDPKARQLILNAGNLILIQIDNLPDWGGVIDGDEDWGDDGTITLSAWSGEHLLSFRRAPTNQVLTASSPGGLIQKMITLANAPEDTLIRAGDIWSGGTETQATLDGKDFYTHIKKVADNRGLDWNVLPELDANGWLYFKLHLWEKRGVKSSLVLKEGYNIKKRGKPLKVRTGGIINDLLGLGDASTDNRPSYNEIDQESRGLYGLRQGSMDFDGCSTLGTVTKNTQAELKKTAKPKRLHQLEALNVGRTFESIDLGNIHPLDAFSYGWRGDGSIGVDARVEILGMRYKSKTDTVELTNNEVIE